MLPKLMKQDKPTWNKYFGLKFLRITVSLLSYIHTKIQSDKLQAPSTKNNSHIFRNKERWKLRPLKNNK